MASTGKPYVIVVGIDYSAPSEAALERALELGAEKPNAEVHVVHAVPPEAAYTPDGAVPVTMREGGTREALKVLATQVENALARQRDRAGAVPKRTLSHIRIDIAPSELAQVAADLEADLVVVGTHGRRGLARFALGSVAETTVRLAPCAVLVVRAKGTPEPLPKIEPPCPECVKARAATDGKTFWCEQHSERHGQRHTYHQGDRGGAGNLPSVAW